VLGLAGLEDAGEDGICTGRAVVSDREGHGVVIKGFGVSQALRLLPFSWSMKTLESTADLDGSRCR
jgi:hypothetical protein